MVYKVHDLLKWKNENCCFIKNDIITLHNMCQLIFVKKTMFLLLTFPLVDQIETFVAI
jgi:hypothetical protein